MKKFLKLPKVEQDKYHKNLKVYRDLINSIDTAHTEGKIEEKLEIAKKSLSENIDIKTIALITGLTVEEIEGLTRI